MGIETSVGKAAATDFDLIEGLLPSGWQEKARELGALRRGRSIADARTLLRVMMIHIAEGCGLRDTAERARLGGIATVSDVAILKRLRGCGAWFEWMCQQLRTQWLPPPLAPALGSCWAGRRIRLVDGTVVSEPGATGSQWRLHYAIELPSLSADEVIVGPCSDGETFKRFTVKPGDIIVGDRGYAHPAGVAHVDQGAGQVMVRMNLVTLPLYRPKGERLDVLALAETLTAPGQCGAWPAQVRHGKRQIDGRLCAIRKSDEAAKKARERVRRESQRGGTTLRAETLAAADYVLLFTTLPAAFPAAQIMELYRARWQIELAFKRLKSLVALGHLKKHDAAAARAWLQGKLLAALLIDALLATRERFSPWGYCALAEGDPKSLSVA